MSEFKVMGRIFSEMQERAALVHVERVLRETEEPFDMSTCLRCVGHFVGRAMGMTGYEAATYVEAFSDAFDFDPYHTTTRVNHPLRKLYYPENDDVMSLADQYDAADATARYLLGGEPWPEDWA